VRLHLTDDLHAVDDDALNLDVQPNSPSPDDAKHAPGDAIPVEPSDGDGEAKDGELEKPTFNPTNFWFYPLDVYKKHKVCVCMCVCVGVTVYYQPCMLLHVYVCV
jgi:hypothetical protein